MLCDRRGRCVWTSDGDLAVKAGEPVWGQLSPDSQAQAKIVIGQVLALRESHQLEVVHQNGDRFRGWLWPLDSPEIAVCILGLRIPGAIAQLTERERACLELLALGTETRLIAEKLDVSLSTVHTHLKHAREKLGLASMDALISFAARYFYPVSQPLDTRREDVA
jgi:DNA-binding CsgD family transcriptional regulator